MKIAKELPGIPGARPPGRRRSDEEEFARAMQVVIEQRPTCRPQPAPAPVEGAPTRLMAAVACEIASIAEAVQAWLGGAPAGDLPATAPEAAPASTGHEETRLLELADLIEVPEPIELPVPVDLAEPALELDLSDALEAPAKPQHPIVLVAEPLPLPAPVERQAPVAATEAARPIPVLELVEEPKGRIGPAVADITIGDGDDRVDLRIATHGPHVHVTAVAETAQMTALRDGASELAASLARHGLSLDLATSDRRRSPQDAPGAPAEPTPHEDDDDDHVPDGVRIVA